MVAQHTNTPDEPLRPLSPEVELQLETALRAFARGAPEGEKLLGDVVLALAAEARARSLRPEEMLVAFKRVEERIETLGQRDDQTRSDFRLRMLRGLLEAYYRA